jgi:hypothetical protein
MTEEETITLLSLKDASEASVIKLKLETEGIACFMDSSKSNQVNSKIGPRRSVDLRVYLKDLDKALKMINDDEKV